MSEDLETEVPVARPWISIVVCCPEDMVDAANALARCIGYSEADELTFTDAPRYEVDDHIYAVPCIRVRESFLEDALTPLAEPEWGANLPLAIQAQALLQLWEDDGTPPIEPICNPEAIIVVANMDVGLAKILLVGTDD